MNRLRCDLPRKHPLKSQKSFAAGHEPAATGDAAPDYPVDKRWSERRMRWRAPGELIKPTEFGVEVLRERDAKTFVQAHHYSASMPPARLSVGLFRKTGVEPARLVGVAVFSVPMQAAAIACYTGCAAREGVELGRFVLLPEVAFNGETWFLKRAFQALRQEKGGPGGVRSIISFADPLERRDAAGQLTKPSHAGTIYSAHNAVFAGRSSAQYLWLSRAGRVISRRSLNKIVHEDTGHAYATRQLLTAGAPCREARESPKAWLERVLPLIATRVRHPGNFVFAFGLDAATRRQVQLLNGATPYPKLPRVA